MSVFGWTSLLWFTSALGFAAGDTVVLEAPAVVQARCGDSVTLTCDASSLQTSDIRMFAWLYSGKTLCQHSAGQADPGVLCEFTAGPSRHRLTLTLLNVMPGNQGKYICKLRSIRASDEQFTNLTMKNCKGSSDNSSANNLTDANIRSSVSTVRRNQNQGSRVSPCLRADGTCLSTQVTTVGRTTSAGGQLDRLHWICVLVEIMMFKSVA